MSAVVFLKPGAEHEPPRYVVIAARCRGAWLLCRKRGQDTWELPGGHIEAGETPFDAARRELYEETGSVGSELIPVSDYRIDDCGVLFFTELSAISVPPACFEMEEVRLFPFLPDRLSYPLFHPPMFTFVQYWLNLRSGAGEPWDLYTSDRKKTGLVCRRGEPIPEGLYHLVVHVWLRGSDGTYLLTRRAPEKGYPNLWETTGGSALSGDDSLHAALREVEEETGIRMNPADGVLISSRRGPDYLLDIWRFDTDTDPADVVLLPGETTEAKRATPEEIEAMLNRGEFVPYSDFEALKKLL